MALRWTSRDRSAASRTLAFLRDCARLHFAAEEALMKAVAYPARQIHQAEHVYSTDQALGWYLRSGRRPEVR